jgi:hypothetical protein
MCTRLHYGSIMQCVTHSLIGSRSTSQGKFIKHRQEKIYQHFCSIWRPLAAKCAICTSHPEAYGIRYTLNFSLTTCHRAALKLELLVTLLIAQRVRPLHGLVTMTLQAEVKGS